MWEFQLPLDIFSHDYSPKTEKIYLNLDWIDRENHELAGKIVFTLDATFPEQKKAIDIFGADQTLSFRTKADLGGHSRIILKVLNELYRSELWQVLDREPSTLVDRKVLYNVLAPFAIEGKTVYRKLFRQSDYVGLPSSSKQLLADAVHSVLSHSAIIDIDSDNALFPWSFLYVGDHNDCDGGTTIEPEKFLVSCMRYKRIVLGLQKKLIS